MVNYLSSVNNLCSSPWHKRNFTAQVVHHGINQNTQGFSLWMKMTKSYTDVCRQWKTKFRILKGLLIDLF